MSTSSLGRPSKKPAALSEVAVARVTAAVHGAMVCFVLVVVVSHLAGFHLGMIGQVALVATFLTGAGAGALAVGSRPRGGRG